MAESITVAKKRGRPKKVAAVDTIVVIDSSVDASTDVRATKSRKANGRKSAIETTENEATPRRRVTRTIVVKDDTGSEATKATRTKRCAKSIANATSSALEKIVDVAAQTSAPSKSTILEQASAFKDTRKSETATDQAQIVSQQASTAHLARISSSLADIVTNTSSEANTKIQQALESAEIAISNLINDIQSSSIERIELSLLRRATKIEQIQSSIDQIRSVLDQRVRFAARTQTLERQITCLDTSIQESSNHIQSLRRASLERLKLHRLHEAVTQLGELEAGIQQSSVDIKSLFSARAAASTALKRSKALQALHLQTDSLTSHIQQSGAAVQSIILARPVHQPEIVFSNTMPVNMSPRLQAQSSTTSPPSTSTQVTSQLSPSTSASQPQSQSTKPTPQPITSASTSRPTNIPLTSKAPPPTQPRPQPRPLRPTEQPYEVLRRTPQFKRQSRQWTGIIVGIPVLIASSWVLYKRYQDTLAKRRLEESDGRQRGELPIPAIGVDRKSSVGVNGGV